MSIQWAAYDLYDGFTVFDAACLWLEIEPSREVMANVPPSVETVFTALKRNFGGCSESFFAINQANGELIYPLPPRGERREGFNEEYLLLPDNPEADCFWFPGTYSRQQFIDYANQKDQRPKFLFPEERDSSGVVSPDDQIDNNYPGKKRRPNTWRRLVKILAIASGNLPDDSDAVGRLLRIAETNGIKLGDDTIRDCLKEAFDVDQK